MIQGNPAELQLTPGTSAGHGGVRVIQSGSGHEVRVAEGSLAEHWAVQLSQGSSGECKQVQDSEGSSSERMGMPRVVQVRERRVPRVVHHSLIHSSTVDRCMDHASSLSQKVMLEEMTSLW